MRRCLIPHFTGSLIQLRDDLPSFRIAGPRYVASGVTQSSTRRSIWWANSFCRPSNGEPEAALLPGAINPLQARWTASLVCHSATWLSSYES